MKTPESTQPEWRQEPITSHSKVAGWMNEFLGDQRRVARTGGHDLTGNTDLRDKFLRDSSDTKIRVQVTGFYQPGQLDPEKMKLLVTVPDYSVESFEMFLSGNSLKDYLEYAARHAR